MTSQAYYWLKIPGGAMLTRTLDRDRLSITEDWQGNNVALACPVCFKVFITSGMIHKTGRECPNCGKSKVIVSQDGKAATVTCNEGGIPTWKSE
jgi:hypothetical protein